MGPPRHPPKRATGGDYRLYRSVAFFHSKSYFLQFFKLLFRNRLFTIPHTFSFWAEHFRAKLLVVQTEAEALYFSQIIWHRSSSENWPWTAHLVSLCFGLFTWVSEVSLPTTMLSFLAPEKTTTILTAALKVFSIFIQSLCLGWYKLLNQIIDPTIESLTVLPYPWWIFPKARDFRSFRQFFCRTFWPKWKHCWLGQRRPLVCFLSGKRRIHLLYFPSDGAMRTDSTELGSFLHMNICEGDEEFRFYSTQ